MGPLLLPVADAKNFVGSMLEVPLRDPWPEAMYANTTVAIKDLVKGLGAQPTIDAREPKRAGDGAGASPPVPTPQSLPRSRQVHPSNRPGQLPQPRSAVLECPHQGPPRANATEAHSSAAANSLRRANRVAAGPSASGAQLAPRPPSEQAGIRVLSRRGSGEGCLFWAVP